MSDDLVTRLRTQSVVFDIRGRDIANEAADEIVRLRAELRGRTQNFDDACATLAKVEAERDALRRDAERYRWLRMKEVRVHQDREPYGCIMAASELALDDGIDRALREEKTGRGSSTPPT